MKIVTILAFIVSTYLAACESFLSDEVIKSTRSDVLFLGIDGDILDNLVHKFACPVQIFDKMFCAFREQCSVIFTQLPIDLAVVCTHL